MIRIVEEDKRHPITKKIMSHNKDIFTQARDFYFSHEDYRGEQISVVDDEGKKSLLTDYCFFNNKDFDSKKIYEFRIYNTNELTTKFYNKYIETKDSLFLDLLSKEMVHISYYKLSKRKFRWYIIEEPHNSELVSKEKKGLFYKLRKDANKWIKKNKKQ